MNEIQNWYLEVTHGPDAGRKFPLGLGESLVIGRGSQSDTQIRDPSVSRVHCEIRWDQKMPIIVDLGGVDGTKVDGAEIEHPESLLDGSIIVIGQTQMLVQHVDALDADTLTRPAPPTPPDVAITKVKQLEGQTFLRFKLEKLITVTPNSIVFRGVDQKYERQVAVKILRQQMTSKETQKERFIRAMRTMQPIVHPHIVRTRKAGRTGNYCWAAFDWVEGISVRKLIEQIGISGMLDWQEVLRVGVHIGRALEEAGRHKIVHRNITPDNLLRRQKDHAFLLTDLIYARALEYTDAAQLTRPGEIVGDLSYMAPERLIDSTLVDPRSDQYSLGATLYALLTGVPPYEAEGLSDLIKKHANGEPKHPSEFALGLNENFCDVVMRMIKKEIDHRYPSMTELLEELQKLAPA